MPLSKVLPKIKFWKQTCFHPYLQKNFDQSHPQKDVNPHKLRWKVDMRQDLVVPQLIKQGQRIFSVSTPDTQLFAISATEKKLNNLQKQ